MKRNGMESLYWQTNESWYKVTPKGKFVLTNQAPKKARKSFHIYKHGRPVTLKRLKTIIESYFIEFIIFSNFFQKRKKI